jgi:ribosomal protein L11 methyltransferase
VGCGTGILAMAIVKAGAKNVIASDNDRDAVIVTEENMKANRIPGGYIKPVLAEGFKHPSLRGEYDLIVANILARPLIDMAPDIKRHLAPGGTVILSGLLRTQEREVLAAYSLVGLKRRQYFRSGDWSALLLTQ